VAGKLIGPSLVGWGDDKQCKPGPWWPWVKLDVVEWDGDGRLDPLLGDH
jgi:hypothetical protein